MLVPLYVVACGAPTDPGVTERIRQAVGACTCGSEATPWTAFSPNISPGVIYVDPTYANQWAVDIPSPGECIMGQYSKPMTFFGQPVYKWVANPGIACPETICPASPNPCG
jgi:hypothetical protein